MTCSVVKSIGCASRGPRSNSSTHMAAHSQMSVTSVSSLRALLTSVGIRHAYGAHTGKTHKIKFLKNSAIRLVSIL